MLFRSDGSLTLYIQKDSPGTDRESNWLPAPDGPIYLVMRLYWPKTEAPSILPPGQGTWQPPAVANGRATLMTFPVIEAEDMPDVAANSYSIAFGDFNRGYKIIDRATINFTVDDMSQRASGLIRYSSRMRCDARPVDTSAIRILTLV